MSNRPNFIAARQAIEHRIFGQWMIDRKTGLMVPHRGGLVRLSSLSERQIAEHARKAANRVAAEGVRRHEIGEK